MKLFRISAEPRLTAALVVMIAVPAMMPNPSSSSAQEPSTCGSHSSDGLDSDSVEGLDAVACDLIGETIVEEEEGVLALNVPQPGHTVGIVAEGLDGDIGYMLLEVKQDGTILTETNEDPGTVHPPEEEVPAGDNDPRAVPRGNPCTQTGNANYGFKWKETMVWRLNTSTINNSDLTDADAIAATRAGVQNITLGQNNCDIAGNTSASAGYAGTTSAPGAQQFNKNFSTGVTTISCSGWNGENGVAFRDFIGNTATGVACLDFVDDGGTYKKAIETDVAVNKSVYSWTVTGGSANCVGERDLESTVTHEIGHAFGLRDLTVASSSNAQTMWGSSFGSCDTGKRSLGRGDLIGLGLLY